MALLTIGAFARLSRLSAKALRRYDDLGLLPPARVDPLNGYRYYDEAQLGRARLVAWLRRIGMPPSGIREVCESPVPADRVRAYWARVEAETSARRDLAAFLIDQLSRKDAMTHHTDNGSALPAGRTLKIRYAALSDAGLVRAANQDAAHAGARLLAVADGYGDAGAAASSAAIDALRVLEADGARVIRAGDLLNALGDAADRVHRAAGGGESGGDGPDQESGTTLTAMLWTGSQLALVHIGDSRAYLLRGGELFRITHDHTMVRSMVDEGRLSEAEAASHPQRALLLRALGRGEPDIGLREARSGDRYLLCSDGLSSVVPDDELRRTLLATAADPEGAVRELLALVQAAGAPDNVACAVGDVVESRGPAG
ncbi:MerR family transcriptional regulator [Streptomyces sp. NBC_00344]|uniref:MerR family transcriptional regulator n=1 Tax=Streptomyces sp. NBC_00344 TaxID=2975720 RepID=UPI002E1DDD1E